ncbi:MAG: DUF695 domain-containing protein [Methylophagaceae bacterium]
MSLNLDSLGWSVAEGATDEYDFQVRFRRFVEKPPTTEYNQRLNIFWTMKDPLDTGFANKSELDKLHDFENRLIDAVENDEFSIMTMVLTGRGEREFVFYTSDPQKFLERLTNMPQEQEPYPLEIQCNEDPEWEYYYDEIGTIKNV